MTERPQRACSGPPKAGSLPYSAGPGSAALPRQADLKRGGYSGSGADQAGHERRCDLGRQDAVPVDDVRSDRDEIEVELPELPSRFPPGVGRALLRILLDVREARARPSPGG